VTRRMRSDRSRWR